MLIVREVSDSVNVGQFLGFGYGVRVYAYMLVCNFGGCPLFGGKCVGVGFIFLSSLGFSEPSARKVTFLKTHTIHIVRGI